MPCKLNSFILILKRCYVKYYDHLLRILFKIIYIREFWGGTAITHKAVNSCIIKMTKSPYLKVGQSAKNRLFGIAPIRRLSQVGSNRHSNGRPIQMLVSEKITISNSKYQLFVLRFLLIIYYLRYLYAETL